MAEHTPTSKKVVTTVFIALVLDLLAFTIPLPLFPRLIAWYLQKEQEAGSTILTRLLELSHSWRSLLLSSSKQVLSDTSTKNWDVVLLGGAMGSLFSFCQCIISPSLGSLSDKYGRKNILLATMMGNILSAIIWAQSTTFASFLLSRLVGGLSEGNVQLSTAIISDVTTSSTRSKSLALVGIAFSICFTLGPSLGAYFASRPMPTSSGLADKWNVYATPALISLGLLVAETLYLAVSLPETRWNKKATEASTKDATPTAPKQSGPARLGRLMMIGWLHCIFLLFFSGAEFTLTFLTYDLFAASNSQNGRLLSFIGILAATLQARHVRPSLARRGELNVSLGGLYSSSLAFSLLALLPLSYIRSSGPISTSLLYGAAASLAYTSATVVTGLTAAAAACCDEDDAVDKAGKASNSELRRGRALGKFRSKGQLGRAMGPILASSLYWLRGPTTCYSLLAACTFSLGLYLTSQLKREKARLAKQQ